MSKSISIVLFASFLCAALLMTRHYNTSHPRIHGREALDVENLEAQQLWDYLRLRDPATGEIPRGIHTRELAFARTIVSNHTPLKGRMEASTPTIHTTGWNSAGPINAGGRTRAIGIDVANDANVLIATAQGGVFRSTDSGQSWARTTAPGDLKDMSSLIQDHRPGKTGIWYAGTGEIISTTWRRTAVYTEPDYHSANIGNGIYKSTDDGLTWNVLLSTVSPHPTVLDSAFDGVWNIVLDSSRSDSDIVYAAAFGAIMRSNDGGGHWDRVLGDRVHASIETDVAITSAGILYAYLSGQTEEGGEASTAGVWRSTDGFRWTNITPAGWGRNSGRMKIAIAPSNEKVLYLGGVDPNIFYGAILQKYTYRSGDGSGSGGIWEDRSANVPAATDSVGSYGLNTYGGYAITLAVHPSDPNIVFFGGTNLYRSWDGFATPDRVEWIGGYDPANGAYGEAMNDHPDHRDLIFDPSNPSIAYNANDGGIYKTEDVLGYDDPNFPVIWQDINFNDPASILYDVALDHATPGDTTVLGGFQDQGSWLSYDSANYWIPYADGDGCYCAIADNKVAYYMSSQEGYVSRWTIGADYSVQGYAGLMPNGATQAQFVTPWMLDPANTNQMYFADNNTLWRNDDLAGVPDNQGYTTDVNWVQLDNSPQAANTYITALGMSVLPAHRLYYGTSDGHLYRMDNADGASPTPKEITGSIFPKNAFICCVAVDPQNADSIVVCFSNYHVISIFGSNDGGTTWYDASGNLEQNPDGSGDGPSVRWVTIVHQNGEELYLCGTSVGLFSTTNISGPNVTWNPEGVETIGRAIVENIDARQSDGFVAIATQGSGVYTTHVTASPSEVGSNSAKQFAFNISPNPSTGKVTALFTLPASVQIKWTVVDVSGRTVLSPNAAEFPAGPSTYTMDCSRLTTGTYFVQLQAGDAIETRRLVIER